MSFVSVIYIYHDCFAVKTEDAVLIFDFWKDPYQKGPLPNPLQNVDPDTPIYVFVSHSHKDHYNPEIFSWAEHFKNIHYIVSKDVRKRINHILNPDSIYSGPKIKDDQLTVLHHDDHYSDDIIEVRSFPSTDIGNSYAVNIAGRNIFHAGDLNAWIWKDESTQQEINKALGDFNVILNKIAQHYNRFDICFFPVDSRIGTDYFTGAAIFLRRFKIDNFLPMHYELADDPESVAGRHRDAAAFALYASPTCRHYLLSAPYSVYTLY
ncbi:MAG: MBL fold metallo-hydrolase [Muribaculaceae bacterium]|nr:MBL fold metallo-hydrolase [Muribaculaceae bacterium]